MAPNRGSVVRKLHQVAGRWITPAKAFQETEPKATDNGRPFGKNMLFFRPKKPIATIPSMEKWYIYLHECLIFMVNVSEYTSPMDPMGRIPTDYPPKGFRVLEEKPRLFQRNLGLAKYYHLPRIYGTGIGGEWNTTTQL